MGTGQRDVIWAPSAYADLDQALAHREDAAALLEDVLDAAASLSTFSERGRLVPDLDDAVTREIFVRDAADRRVNGYRRRDVCPIEVAVIELHVPARRQDELDRVEQAGLAGVSRPDQAEEVTAEGPSKILDAPESSDMQLS